LETALCKPHNDVVWLNRFKLNRFETGLSASVNGAIDHPTHILPQFILAYELLLMHDLI